MDNYIDFYSIPYNKDSFNQPYFKTSEARDAFFGKYTPLRVNALGVNINLKYDYQFELKVNVDVVNMDDYNFAILNYNSKKFYCNIDDYEQISVNRSRVRVTRNPVFEVIDFFQYFTNLLVERDDTDYTDFTPNSSNVSTYKGRYYPQLLRNAFSYYRNGTQVDATIIDGYFIFLSNIPIDDSGINDTVPQSVVLNTAAGQAIHMRSGSFHKNYYCVFIQAIAYDVTFDDFLDAVSPYIISIHSVKFPYISLNDGIFVDWSYRCCIKWPNASTSGYGSTYGFIIDDCNGEDTYFQMVYSFQGDGCFDKLELFIMGLSNKIELNFKDFVRTIYGNGTIYVRFRYIISQSQISLLVWPYATSSEAPIGISNKAYISTVPLITSYDYATDGSAKWASENRYYDQLTNNSIQLRMAKGMSQFGENMLTGAAQIGMGASVMGYSNLVRGAFEPINAVIDNEYYARERDLLEAQARAVPDKINSTPDSISFFNQLGFSIYVNKLTPFSSDFNRFKQDLLKYGTHVNKSIDTVDTSSDFILKAVAQRNTSALPDMQYNKLYEYVRAGHKYIIGG